jgi:hypothetical protein
MAVQDVPADEGFWVGEAPGRRLWVELVGEGESAVQVRVGDRVSFVGTTVRSSPEYPASVGLSRTGGPPSWCRRAATSRSRGPTWWSSRPDGRRRPRVDGRDMTR